MSSAEAAPPQLPACERVTVVVTTSPSPAHPQTYMIEMAIESVARIVGLRGCQVVIVMDHYSIVPDGRAKPKQGKVTSDMASLYEAFEVNLKELYAGNPSVRIVRCESHLGFSLAVKKGLSLCMTEYALICQHDRLFKREVDCIDRLLQMFQDMPHLRYVGFPSVSSNNHHQTLWSRYQLYSLLSPLMRPPVEDGLSFLQPTIFWFDSQHLCHIDRYMQIYEPYRHTSDEVKAIIDAMPNGSIGDLILRKGDFTEDRLGQMQRKIFMHLRATCSDGGETINRVFKSSFGSYLYFCKSADTGAVMGGDLYDSSNTPLAVAKDKVNFWRQRAGRDTIDDYEQHFRETFS